jgi:hypothetical protein
MVWGLRADLSSGETVRNRRDTDTRGYAEEMADKGRAVEGEAKEAGIPESAGTAPI